MKTGLTERFRIQVQFWSVNQILFLKDLYSCPIETIKGLTDEGQFQYLTGLKGPQYTCIQHNFFTKINVSISSEST